MSEDMPGCASGGGAGRRQPEKLWLFDASLGLLVAFALFAPSRAFSQGCCTPGTSPLGGLSGTPLAPGAADFGVAFDGYDLHRAYLGSKRTTDPGGRHSHVERYVSYVRVGLPWETVLVAELPYDRRMREQEFAAGNRTFRFKFDNLAFGDLTTTFLIRAWPRGRPASWGVNLGTGIKWATGSVEAEQEGLRLPVELQSGTGSNDPLFVLTSYWLRPWGGLMLASVTRFPREGRNGYRYGRESQSVALGYYNVGTALNVGPELRLRTAKRDIFAGKEGINTGGMRLMAGPRVIVTWRSARLAFEGAALWPLQQNLTGIQLGVDRELLLSVHWASQ